MTRGRRVAVPSSLRAPRPPLRYGLLLYLRLEGTATRRSRLRASRTESESGAARHCTFRKPSPVVAGRPFRAGKGGGRSAAKAGGHGAKRPPGRGGARQPTARQSEATATSRWGHALEKAPPHSQRGAFDSVHPETHRGGAEGLAEGLAVAVVLPVER